MACPHGDCMNGINRVTITLTSNHLASGIPLDPDLCAIALAVYEATEEEEIKVYSDMVYIGEPEHTDIKVYYLPYDSDSFDEPITFDMILKENRYSDFKLQNNGWERQDDKRDYRIRPPK